MPRNPLLSDSGRPIAPGGWRRAVVGAAVGACVGLLVVVTRRPVDG